MSIELAGLDFEALNYTTAPDNIARVESHPVVSFNTRKEAEDYAMACAHDDKGMAYRVRRIGSGNVVFVAYVRKGV